MVLALSGQVLAVGVVVSQACALVKRLPLTSGRRPTSAEVSPACFQKSTVEAGVVTVLYPVLDETPLLPAFRDTRKAPGPQSRFTTSRSGRWCPHRGFRCSSGTSWVPDEKDLETFCVKALWRDAWSGTPRTALSHGEGARLDPRATGTNLGDRHIEGLTPRNAGNRCGRAATPHLPRFRQSDRPGWSPAALWTLRRRRSPAAGRDGTGTNLRRGDDARRLWLSVTGRAWSVESRNRRTEPTARQPPRPSKPGSQSTRKQPRCADLLRCRSATAPGAAPIRGKPTPPAISIVTARISSSMTRGTPGG